MMRNLRLRILYEAEDEQKALKRKKPLTAVLKNPKLNLLRQKMTD
jgi:hypothetical protein